MADAIEPVEVDLERLRNLELAAHPTRYRLLRHAAVEGPFAEAAAYMIVGSSPAESGAVRAHVRRLHRAGLVTRSVRPITCAITQPGLEIYTYLSQLGTETQVAAESNALVILMQPAPEPVASWLLGVEDELLATLRSVLRGKAVGQATALRVIKARR